MSDEDSDGSQEDDNDVSNSMRFQVRAKKDADGTIANNVATMTVTSSKYGDVTKCSGSLFEFSEDSESNDSGRDELST